MYLKEVQGLRVVAALLVATYHIWFQRVSGGVDAFFVISGYFICRTFFDANVERRIDVLSYYKRTFARVAPSASTVVLATSMIFMLLGMDSFWAEQIKSGIAALLFVENWRLAFAGVDYLGQSQLPSPFQQMWALSVQVQVYLLLPGVLLALWSLSGHFKERKAFPYFIFVLGLCSFAYAVIGTLIDQPWTYFDTFARLWEVLAGVFMGIWLPQTFMAKKAAKIAGYVCLAVLVSFAAVIPVGQFFPGLAALVPVLATGGIILAAINGGNLRLLNSKPMQVLGDFSFTFYLWHWPLLIAYLLMTGHEEVGFLPGVAIIVATGVLSYVTYQFVEKPFRRSRLANARPLDAFSIIALAMVPPFLITALWALAYVTSRDAARQAMVLFQQNKFSEALVPATVTARADVPDSYRNGCNQRDGSSDVIECVYGNPEGDVSIILAGGSHSLHWLPALQEVARENSRFKIIAMTKANCVLALSEEEIELAESQNCLKWSHGVVNRIKQLEPAVIVSLLTSTREGKERSLEHVPAGYHMVWSELVRFPILAIRDTPRSDFDVVSCVDREGSGAPQCNLNRNASLQKGPMSIDRFPENVHPLDLTNIICEDDVCPAVQDNVLVYRDRSHFTATYARTLAPHIGAELQDILTGAWEDK